MSKLKEYEKIVMLTDELDDGSIVVNFDVTDEYNCTTRTGCYVKATQDNDDKCFYVTICDEQGNLLSETVVPFVFMNHEDDEDESND
jgi:hypothetical protein